MLRFVLTLVGLGLSAGLALGADLSKIEKVIKKEPAYQTKTPRYALIAFGPDAADRVWLVWDGNALYVDRNGNGDLTEPGKKVVAEKPRAGRSEYEGYTFEAGELTIGGRTHKGLSLYTTPLAAYGAGSLGARSDVKAVLAKDPKAVVLRLAVDADVPGMKGGGLGGRLSFAVGPIDLDGVLQFADKPADAPIIHFGGPLQVTFYAERPTLRVGRGSEFDLVVGSPGHGPGTYAMLAYEGTIPKTAYPIAEIAFQPAKAGSPPVKEKFELKERC
jgi:hypothetical protein